MATHTSGEPDEPMAAGTDVSDEPKPTNAVHGDHVRPATTGQDQADPDQRDPEQVVPVADPDHQARQQQATKLPRIFGIVVGVAAGWIAIQGIREVQSWLAPILMAITLVVTAYPMIPWLRRHGWPGWLAGLTTLMTIYAVLGTLVLAMGYAVAQLAGIAPTYQPKFVSLYDDAMERLAGYGIDQPQITQQLAKVDAGKVFDFVSGLAGQLMSATSLLILMLTVLMFMSMDAVGMGKRLDTLQSVKPRLAVGFTNFAKANRSYWVVNTIFGLIVAVLDYIALIILGVPLALTWGVFSFVTNYIPNIGLIIGMVPPAVLALLDGGPGKAMWVVVAYLALNTVVQTFIQPKFTGDAVGITATISFVSLIFWAYVLGPLGALLAVPMTTAVKSLLIDTDPQSRWVNLFIASDPSKSPVGALEKPAPPPTPQEA